MKKPTGHLIPAHAQRELEEQDARRAAARETATSDQFRRQFISSFAQEIELIRRGAIVTETVAERKLALNPMQTGTENILERGDEARPAAVRMPDNKPVPTPAAARRHIQWGRFTRFLRRVVGSFVNLWRNIKSAWKGW